MNRKTMDSYSPSLLEQSHQELQLDAIRNLYSQKMNDLFMLKSDTKSLEDSIVKIKQEIQNKEFKNDGLQNQVNHMSLLLQNKTAKMSYEHEYEQRQTYYRHASEIIEVNDIFNQFPSNINDYKGIIVSPDGLHIHQSRIATILKRLSDEGFLCFSFNSALDKDIEKISDHYYQFKNEPLLLKWLTVSKLDVIVFCTWILQAAWFDLLQSKSVWYDVCDHEDVLWGMDATIRLKHYEYQKYAKLVSYSEKKWKRYVGARKNAKLLEKDCTPQIISEICLSLEV